VSLIDSFLNSGTPPHQDYIVLEGKKSPGRATVTGAGSPRTWDKQKGYGFSGATLVYTGNDLSAFDVILELWLDEHWTAWANFAPILVKTPSGKRPTRPLQIGHPILNRAPWSITEVALLDVLAPEQDDDGIWTIRLMFSSWSAPKPALGKPNSKIPGVASTDPFANDPEIRGLMDKQASLGGAL
jgi:hypothetical protein